MSGVSKIVILVLAWSLAGCEMRPLGRAKTPPTPAPEAAKQEPPPASSEPPEPLSIPQTQVQLPRSQPIDPEALATPPVTAATEPASQRPTHRTARRTGPNPAAPTAAKPEPVETAETPPPQIETARPRIEPVLPADQRRQTMEDIASRLKDVDQLLGKISTQRLSDEDKNNVERIKSIANLSHQSLERGEIQQAGALADRALLLAQDLLRAK